VIESRIALLLATNAPFAPAIMRGKDVMIDGITLVKAGLRTKK